MRQFIKDNWEEAVCGGLIGLGVGLICHLRWVVVLLTISCMILYRLGGWGKLWPGKPWRSLGIAILLGCVIPLSHWWLRPLAGLATYGLLQVGYGTKSTQPPDEGSPFGNWCLKVTGIELGGKVLARGIIIISICGVWYGVTYFNR